MKKRKNIVKMIDKADVSRTREVRPRVPLAHWQALRAVVDAGGYAQAAARLHKSQSAVTYSVQKLEAVLGVRMFERRGRKAVLTAAGDSLYRRAGTLLEDAGALERAARELGAGGAAELRLAVDTMFPTWLLLQALARFAQEYPGTRLDMHETVLGGSAEALVAGGVDLAVTSIVPAGYMGDPLLRLRFVAVAAPGHPLLALGRALTRRDLRRYRQLVLRDSATYGRRDAGWLGADSRWTVSHKATSIRAARMGLGFAWYPEEVVREELASGALRRLPLREGSERYADLYLVLADSDYAGPTVRRLAAILREAVAARGRERVRSRQQRAAAVPRRVRALS